MKPLKSVCDCDYLDENDKLIKRSKSAKEQQLVEVPDEGFNIFPNWEVYDLLAVHPDVTERELFNTRLRPYAEDPCRHL